MGRELKMVPLDFNWPHHKVWEGYINPLYKPCPEEDKTCFNGSTAGAQWLDTFSRMFGIVAEDVSSGEEDIARGRIVPHPYMAEMPTAPTYEVPRHKKAEFDKLPRHARTQAYYRFLESRTPAERVIRPSADFCQLVDGLIGDEGVGHKNTFLRYKGISYKVGKKIREAAGLPEDWGICPVCKGSAIDPTVQDAYEAWESTEPPAGPGYQLWETVSEGSPISPVFSSREAFVEYLCSEGFSKKAAENFSKEGWAPSAVITNGKMYEGIESCALPSPRKDTT